MQNQTQTVSNFHDLISTQFHGEINALCWKRNLLGDFSELVNSIALDGNMAVIDEEELREPKLSEQGNIARDLILTDLNLLRDYGASPILNVIEQYDRDDAVPFFSTDVYSFHVDRSPIPTDTFLCTYFGASSEILPNAQGEQKILIPEIRNELKKLYDGPADGFEEFLSDCFFDLHYQAKPNAAIISLGIGNLWRLAVDHPQSKVAPCLHRAPKEKIGEKRLLLIC